MVLTRRLVIGVLLVGPLLVVAATPVLPAAAAAGSSATSASTLYREAVATTRSWDVHYASSSTQSKQTLVVSGDAGPASGSQTDVLSTGSLMILVIGGITYIKGNTDGLENLAGLSSSQSADAAGQWIEFATNNAAFAQVVVGVRSNDVATELLLKGPLSLGHPRTLDGHSVDAIEGTQTFAAQVGARRALRPRPGVPRPGGGGLPEREGAADRRRARDVLEVGRARASPGAPGHGLHRPRRRRVTRPPGGGRTHPPAWACEDVPVPPPGRAGAARAAGPAFPGE